jgi:Tol biopolymer transport system component
MTKHPLIVTGILSLSLVLFSFLWLNNETQSDKFVAEPTYALAFANFGPMNGELFIADEDGNNAKPLVPGPADESNASFSPDGQWVVFTSNRKGPYDIYFVHPDGTGLEQLTHDDAFDDQASFSPDGKKIAFVSTRNGQADIYVLDLATRKSVNISNHAGGDFRPCWSPDGKWIAFSSDRDSKNPRPIFGIWHSTEIFTMRSNGTDVVKRTFIDAVAGSPSWSPDGKKLVCRGATDSTLGLYIVDIETKRITRITRERDNFPGWSPNGDLIAFTSKKNNNYDLFTIKPDGTELKRITTDPGNDAHSVWSPDGEWLAFSSGKTGFKDESALHPQNPQPYGEISVIRANGSDLRILTDNTYEEATPAWMPLKK